MDTQIIITAAASIGFVHTVLGPDHYLPFVMIGKARNWGMPFLLLVTVVCGIGHVLGSVILGLVGISFGISIGFLEGLETTRGDIASWLLIGLGLAYLAWGIRYVMRRKEHEHPHQHENGDHQHRHDHSGSHVHFHGDIKKVTPWALFVIFVLGPCEPLIPLLMYPASKNGWVDLMLVTAAFGLVTVVTMTAAVALLYKGITVIQTGFLERYMHPIAGLIIAVSGIMIKVLGI